MRVRVHPAARRELFAAVEWYDTRRGGLGQGLLGEIRRSIDSIARAPLAWPRWPGAPDLDPPLRRLLTERFGYAIAYQASASGVLVLAFAHTSRRPFYWVGRLDPGA